jgi:hypothetical protein
MEWPPNLVHELWHAVTFEILILIGWKTNVDSTHMDQYIGQNLEVADNYYWNLK